MLAAATCWRLGSVMLAASPARSACDAGAARSSSSISCSFVVPASSTTPPVCTWQRQMGTCPT